MNQHTASEHTAALKLQEHAQSLASAYTKDPQDLAAARLAVLMIACQLEARSQGINSPVIFLHEAAEIFEKQAAKMGLELIGIPNKQEQKA